MSGADFVLISFELLLLLLPLLPLLLYILYMFVTPVLVLSFSVWGLGGKDLLGWRLHCGAN